MTKFMNPTAGPANDMTNSQQDKRTDILSVLRRRRSTFIVVSIVVYGMVLAALVVLPVRYVATSSIIVADQTANMDAGQPIGADKIGDPADLESQILLVKAPRLLRKVVERPDVQTVLNSSGQDANALVDQLQQHYSISAAGRSRVINIAFDSGSPVIAQTLSNALTTTFLEDRRASWVGSSQTSAQSLKQEQAQLNQSLRADEDKIRAVRNSKGLVRGSIAAIGNERLSGISQSLMAAEAAKADAAAKMEEIEKAAKTNVTDSPTVMSNRTISDLKQQLTLLDIEYARSSAVLGPRHPSMVSLEQARDALKSRINIELQAVVNGAKKSFETASALVTQLRQKMHSFETDVETAEDGESSLGDLVRTLETKKARYDDLSKQIARLEAQAPAFSDTTKLVSLAELPTSPYFPKKPPFLFGGLVLAVIMGGAAAIGVDRLNIGGGSVPPALAPRPVQPMLGEIPLLRSKKPAGFAALFSRRGGQTAPDDVLRLARDNPEFRAAIASLIAAVRANERAGALNSVAITSPLPGDGRTLTTIALAYALAASGRRTLIIEGDFHNPAIADILKLRQTPGLAGLLQSEVWIEKAVLPTASPTLFVLPAGRRSAKTTATMASPKMAELLRWARRFDCVLIDTPAHSVSPNAAGLAKLVDGIICCVRADGTDDAKLAATLRDLDAAGGRVLGTVATMAAVKSATASAARPAATTSYSREFGAAA